MIRSILIGTLTISMSLFVMALSAPRLFASFNQLSSAAVLHDLRIVGRFPSMGELNQAIQSKTLELRWVGAPGAELDLATLLLASALKAGANRQDNQTLLAEAETALKRALSQSPSSHIAWNLLAQTYLLQGRTTHALLAIARSYRAVPLDFDNALSRLSLVLPMLDGLDLETISLLGEEVKAMAKFSAADLAATALSTYRADDVTTLLRTAGADEELVEGYVSEARKLLEDRRRRQ